MPKLMVVSCHTPSLLWFRMDMMRFFFDRGFEVIAIGNEEEGKWNDIFAKDHIKYRKASINRNGTNPFEDLKMQKSLVKIMKEENPDFVFSYNAKAVIYGSIAAKKLKIKCSSLIAGVGSVFLSKGIKASFLKTILSLEYKKALKHCKNVYFQNDDDLSLFLNKGFVKKEQVTMINGSGVNLDIFKEMPQPAEFAFLFIGRLIKDKGIIEYLEAARIVKEKYPNVSFLLVGPRDTNPTSLKEDELKKYIDLSIVQYFGEQANVIPFLEKANVVVLPSYREGTPKTVLEGMACGRAIITTDAPGCRQTIVDGVQGFLVPPKDINTLANKMTELINDKELCRSMGKEARKRAEELYDVNKVNNTIFETIRKD